MHHWVGADVPQLLYPNTKRALLELSPGTFTYKLLCSGKEDQLICSRAQEEGLGPKSKADRACSLETTSSASGLYLGMGLIPPLSFSDLLKLLPEAPYHYFRLNFSEKNPGTHTVPFWRAYHVASSARPQSTSLLTTYNLNSLCIHCINLSKTRYLTCVLFVASRCCAT